MNWSNAAQAGALQVVTTDQSGNLGTLDLSSLSGGGGGASAADVATLQSTTARHTSQIAALQQDVNTAFRRIDQASEGVAIALAMGGLALPTGKNVALSANLGFYDGKQAFATQGALRLNDTYALSGGLGIGLDSGRVGGRIGLQAAW